MISDIGVFAVLIGGLLGLCVGATQPETHIHLTVHPVASSDRGRGCQELQVLAHQLRSEVGQSCDIATQPGKAGNEADPDRIADAHHDDGDCRRRILGREGGLHDRHDKNIWLEPDKLGSEPRKQIGVSLKRHVRVAVFNPDVWPFHVAKIAEALPERLHEAADRRRRSEKADRANIARLLPLGGERRGEEAEGKRDGEGERRSLRVLASTHLRASPASG
jgi:hypothetical protein